MKTFKEYLTETVQLNEYDMVPPGWDQFQNGKKVDPPKGNYQEVPSPDPKSPGETWLLLRPAPPTNLPYNPVAPIYWQPLPPGKGGVPSPQIGDDRMGTINTRHLDKNGMIADPEEVSRWLKTLPQSEFDDYMSKAGGGETRWVYANNPNYKGTSAGKLGSKAADPKVLALQQRILAKDPKALPKFGADGQMGSETRAAMKRLGIKESLELQRILDIVKF